MQGRFTTRDTWGGDPNAPMSYNGWLYAYGNSVNLTDPSGQCTGLAPWTDMLGYALNNPATGLSGVPGYLDAARAAGQKAGENCAQNLSKATTRFQEGNYGSSFFYASGLNTTLNEAQGLLAEVNRGDFGTKARASFERQDYGTAALYALRAPQVARAGLAWQAGWDRDMEIATTNRFVRMYYQDPYTWWTGLRPEDLPDLLEAGGAYCRIGGTALTIASFITPGLYAVKAGITSRWAAIRGPLTGEALAGMTGESMAGSSAAWVNPRALRYSQRSAGAGGRYQALKESMSQQGWNGPAIDVVETPRGLATIDNTRPIVASDLGMQHIPANIHGMGEPLPKEMIGRFGNARTWGEALSYRTTHQVPPLPPTGTEDVPYVRGR